jgi:prevent-host-death family protein
MRLVGIRELKQKTMDLLKDSEKGDIVITSHGKPLAVLHHLSEDDLADYLVENDPAFRGRIEEAMADYLSQGGIPVDALIANLEKRSGNEEI